jgi:MFS family permease
MLNKLRTTFDLYPKQYWLLVGGMLISMLGSTMIWPFLLIYASKRLNMPLAQIATLMTINAAVGVAFTFVAGPVTDKFGRKWVMILGLMMNAIIYIFMMRADTYTTFAILMAFSGAASPLYRIGADAMIADIIPEIQRLEAFALIRMAKNVGVSMGPAIGGILAAISYDITFVSAAIGMTFFGLLLVFFAKETLPKHENTQTASTDPTEKLGYKYILRDKPFIAMIAIYSFGWITAVLMWILLPVYANQNYDIPENIYGLIPTTNALIVIFFQVIVTKKTKRFRPLSMMALGMSFYAIGTGSVALGHSFWGFWISIVIITIGELIIVPTSSAYVANRAHPEMRGRYMGIYNLAWSFARGVGPVMGGWLSDAFGPPAIWYGGLIVGSLSSLGLLFLAMRERRNQLIPV